MVPTDPSGRPVRETRTPPSPSLDGDAAPEGVAGLEDTAEDDGFEEFLAAVAQAPPPLRPPRLQPGESFGPRYRIERTLGAGGMGTVYLARDLDLDRNVALKLPRQSSGGDGWTRLEKEAKAMARLSHPGIVTVYETGRRDEHVFIAMEFVPGSTLRDWMDAEPRPWREVLRMFIPIAHALYAAHESAVVHRDFKPENVLLGLDERPRIADFGLAHLYSDPTITATSAAQLALPRHPGSIASTASGAIVGTPAYMAPEQYRGERASEQSDQFSFCVTLFEALFATRPFRGRTVHELLDAIEAGTRVVPDNVGQIPSNLRRAVERGLEAQTASRHPSMLTLAIELERILTARRRRQLQLGVGAAVVVAGGLGFASAASVEPVPCADVETILDGVWDGPSRDRVASALAGRPVGADVEAALDDYADRLVEVHRSACEANQVEHTLSDEDLALRSTCLQRSLGRMQVLIAEISDPAARPYEASVVRQTLPDPAQCGDTEALRRMWNRWRTESLRGTVDADRAYAGAMAALTKATARATIGDPSVAALLDEIEADARRFALQDVEARVLMLRADLQSDPARRAELLEAAASTATAIGDSTIAADASTLLAQAALDRGDLPAAELHLAYRDRLASLAEAAGSPADAASRALVGARIQLARGRAKDAIEPLRALVADLDPGSIRRVEALALLGQACLRVDRLDEAAEALEAALASDRPISPQLRFGLLNDLAIVERDRGDLEAARARFDAAEATLDDMDDPSAINRSIVLNNLGELARLRDELAEAAELQQRALALIEGVDPNHPKLAYVLDEIGELERRAGNLDAAQAALARSGQIRDAAYGPGNVYVVQTLVRMARVALDQGRPERAEGALRAARSIVEGHDPLPYELAEIDFELARVAAATADAPGARAQAEAARDRCAGSDHHKCTHLVRTRILPWLEALR